MTDPRTLPLISVITPTWRRHVELFERCIDSVFMQTYPSVEHVIVSDGPDRELAVKLSLDTWRRPLTHKSNSPLSKVRPLHFDQLYEHIEGAVDYGSRARNRGLHIAKGELIAYLDDDNAFRPEHLALLAAQFVADPSLAFAYSQMIRHPREDIIGVAPPMYCQIDTSIIMHRAGVPETYGWWPTPDELTVDKHAPDWGVVSRWLDAGATWKHVPVVTVDYYLPGSTQ